MSTTAARLVPGVVASPDQNRFLKDRSPRLLAEVADELEMMVLE